MAGGFACLFSFLLFSSLHPPSGGQMSNGSKCSQALCWLTKVKFEVSLKLVLRMVTVWWSWRATDHCSLILEIHFVWYAIKPCRRRCTIIFVLLGMLTSKILIIVTALIRACSSVSALVGSFLLYFWYIPMRIKDIHRSYLICGWLLFVERDLENESLVTYVGGGRRISRDSFDISVSDGDKTLTPNHPTEGQSHLK